MIVTLSSAYYAPQDVDFSSVLSDAQHAVPQAAAVFFSSFHSAIFDNAIINLLKLKLYFRISPCYNISIASKI